jgi:hypothetical protein
MSAMPPHPPPRDRPAAARWVAALAVVVVVPLLDYWEGLHPPSLDFPVAAFLSVTVSVGAFAVGSAGLRNKPAPAMARLLRWYCIAVGVCLIAYLALFFTYTLPLPDHYHREIIGWELTTDAQESLRGPLPKTVPELLREWGSDVDHVFSGRSLAVTKTAFVALWVVLYAGFGLGAALAVRLVEQSRHVGVYALDRLGERVAALGKQRPEFAEPLRHAYQYIRPDPSSSLTKSRMILETILVRVFESEMGRPPRKPLLGEILNDNQFTRKLDRRVVELMNAIRAVGNLGPHGTAGTPADAAAVLDKLCDVIEWEVGRCPSSGTAVQPD